MVSASSNGPGVAQPKQTKVGFVGIGIMGLAMVSFVPSLEGSLSVWISPMLQMR